MDTNADSNAEIIQVDAPEYIKDDRFNKETREKYRKDRRNICSDLGLLTHPHLAASGVQIFEILAHFARSNNNQISVNACLKQVAAYGAQQNVAGINTALSARNTFITLIKLLSQEGYLQVLTGDPEDPGIIALTDPQNAAESAATQQDAEIKQKITNIISRMQGELTKNSRDFPTLKRIQAKLKEENPDMDLSLVPFNKFIIPVACSDMTTELLNQASETNKFLQIKFNDNSSILLLARNIVAFIQQNLPGIVKGYIEDNKNLDDDIKLFYSKKNKKTPPIESVFTDQVDEDSFFWIKTFYDILEAEQRTLEVKNKNMADARRFIYHVSSILYQYTLNRRKILLEKDAEENERKDNMKQLVLEMIRRFLEPWTGQYIIDFLNGITKLEKQYLVTDIDDVIQTINAAVPPEMIPAIITIKTEHRNYYVHKYRFYLMFFNLLKKERIRMQTELVEKWYKNPNNVPTSDGGFDKAIRDGISPRAHEIFKVHIPNIAGHINVNDNLLPGDVDIRSGDLTDTSLLDAKANKENLNMFIKTVYTNKNMQAMRPLREMMGIKLSDIKKMVKKKIPLYKRSKLIYFFSFFWLFGWILNIFANSQLKETLKREVFKASKENDPMRALDEMQNRYMSNPEMGPSQHKVIKQVLHDAKAEVRQKQAAERKAEKMQEKAEHDKKDSLKKKQIVSLETAFGEGGTLEEMEKIWGKRCFHRIGSAQSDSENSVKSAIKAHFRKRRGGRADPEVVKSYAKKIVEDNRSIFVDVNDTSALIHYVEIIIAMAFRRKLRGF